MIDCTLADLIGIVLAMEMTTLPNDFPRMRRGRTDVGSPGCDGDHGLGEREFGEQTDADMEDEEHHRSCCGQGCKQVSHDLGIHGIRRMAAGNSGAFSPRR